MRRRQFMMAASGLGAQVAMAGCAGRTRGWRGHGVTFVDGLAAPESPKWLADGSIVVCEMASGTISRVEPGRRIERVAELGGSPNGLVMLDHRTAMVCNNGGFIFAQEDGLYQPRGPAPDARGRIELADIASGTVRVLHDASSVDGMKAPNDLIIDTPRGGVWWTDSGFRGDEHDQPGAVFYCDFDGDNPRLVTSIAFANGIALSPGGDHLYVVQSRSGRLVRRAIAGPGALAPAPAADDPLAQAPDGYGYDSMAVDRSGRLLLGALRRGDVAGPWKGQMLIYDADGSPAGAVPLPERFVTSVGVEPGARSRIAISLTTTGRLAIMDWPQPGGVAPIG